ncbi:MAG: heavy metal-binding domain-containing protein [Prevotella sp.]|nr:heavy metal-binding domain-containing protein [Prevotella sp.]
MQEMMQRAQAMGANAIVSIDIDYETVGANGSMLMVATSGTADLFSFSEVVSR